MIEKEIRVHAVDTLHEWMGDYFTHDDETQSRVRVVGEAHDALYVTLTDQDGKTSEFEIRVSVRQIPHRSGI